MMILKRSFLILTMMLLILAGCSKSEQQDLDKEYPVINIDKQDAFPKQCSVIKRGEKFVFRAELSDNVQLGSVSVDVHHNFDHHSHTTELNDCTFEANKAPVKPFLLIQNYPIPANEKTYQISAEITVPTDIDPGDYHFMIRLTDKEGWQTIKGLSIKIE